MKRIGIITFHSAHNYGAMLQAFALQKRIRLLNSNYDVRIINYRNELIDKQYKIFKVQKGTIKEFIKSSIWSMLFLTKNIKRYIAFNKFMNTNFTFTDKVYKSEIELKKESPDFDFYIVGSDQVWNTKLTQGLQDSYTLNFGKENIKRISYAASIGNSEITEKEKDIFKDKLSKLDYISVREETGKNLLEPILKKKVEVVLDPTLLLEKKYWEEEVKGLIGENEKYIFAYRVGEGEEYRKIVKFLSKITGIKVIHLETKKVYENVLKNVYTEGPFEFLNYIKNAEYVVTNSFHATAFSIIFCKKFFVVPHAETGCRVLDLLNKLNLENRVFFNIEDFQKTDYYKVIDYNSVNKLLEIERKKSIEFLEKTLNLEEEKDK